MKKTKKLTAMLLALGMTASLAACGGDNPQSSQSTGGETQPSQSGSQQSQAPSGEKQNVSLRVWGAEEDQALLTELIEGFKTEYADYANFDIQLGVESESKTKDDVLTDPEAAADVYAFASDQLFDLVQAGALQAINANMSKALETYAGKTLDEVKEANNPTAVESCMQVNPETEQKEMYAFPMTAGNNFFLYYDSSVISEEAAASWDSILDAAQAAGKKVGMTLNSGWYNAAFFMGAGFSLSMDDAGTTTIDWNGTTSSGITGVDVVESMLAIASHPAFQAVADGELSNAIASGDLCAVIDGTWDAGAVQKAFGDGYAASDLPTFTCAGKQVSMSGFTGFKMMGVNAHSKQAGWATLLAEWLTNEKSQISRFAQRQLAPTNLKAGEDKSIEENVAVSASIAADANSSLQTTGANFWDPTATFGQMVARGELKAGDTAGIQKALDNLVEGVNAPVGG